MAVTGPFRIGDWTAEPDLDRISRGEDRIHLRPQVMRVLVYLSERQGEVVHSEDLMHDLWSGKIVTDATLYNCVAELRNVLNEASGGRDAIQTVPKKGYRLRLPVSGIGAPEPQDPLESSPQAASGYARRWIWLSLVGLVLVASAMLIVSRQFSGPDEAVSVREAGPPVHSIAVLPFNDLSPDRDQEYFSDGISEEILNLLAKVPELRVTSRSSAFSFKEQNLDVPTIAARLNVTHVLEGSVRKSGNQLRITVQLIEGVTDKHLWSETYNRELKDVFAIQDEIAAAVVGALKITLLGRELKTTETSPEAYALYLQGRHLNNQGTAESNKQAETLLKQVLEIDPGLGPAWTELGSVYALQAGQFALRPVDEAYELARDAIQQALAIDPQYGEAYSALASIEMYYDFDFVAASQHLQQARRLNPGDAAIVGEAAQLKKTLGRIDEAIDLYRQSVALDPVSPNRHYRLGRMYYFAHRLEEAANLLQLALSLSPSHSSAQYYLSMVWVLQGNATAALEKLTDDWTRLPVLAIVQHALGDGVGSDAALNKLIEIKSELAAYQIAQIFAFRGEIDHAFDWLERAYDARDAGLTHLLVDPLLVNLHDDPRWESLLDKMGLPH